MSRMKIYSWTAGLVAALFSIAVAWVSLELPRVAFISEVKASSEKLERQISKLTISVDRISSFNIDTRQLLLNQEWWRIQVQIETYEAKPPNDTIRFLVLNLKKDQDDIKRQLAVLKGVALNLPIPRSGDAQ